MRIVIKDATIIAGDELDVVEKGHLIIEEGRVAKIGMGTCSGKVDVEIDASGMIITPGFISGHSHVWDAGIKDVGVGEPIDDFLFGHAHCTELLKRASKEDFTKVIKDALLEMLEGGIVAQCDFGCGGSGLVLRAAKDIPIKLIALESLCLWAGQGMECCKFSESELLENKKKTVRNRPQRGE